MQNHALSPDELGPTICVGEILVEIVATTTGDGFRSAQPLVGPYPSGAPAIFIDQCSRLGGSAAMIGAVGDDDFGRVNLDRLRADGVDVSAVAIDREFPTGGCTERNPSPVVVATISTRISPTQMVGPSSSGDKTELGISTASLAHASGGQAVARVRAAMHLSLIHI